MHTFYTIKKNENKYLYKLQPFFTTLTKINAHKLFSRQGLFCNEVNKVFFSLKALIGTVLEYSKIFLVTP